VQEIKSLIFALESLSSAPDMEGEGVMCSNLLKPAEPIQLLSQAMRRRGLTSPSRLCYLFACGVLRLGGSDKARRRWTVVEEPFPSHGQTPSSVHDPLPLSLILQYPGPTQVNHNDGYKMLGMLTMTRKQA
jgi:hypothetical protein